MNLKLQTQSAQFSINEVVALLNYTVIKHDRGDHFVPENLGIICGVLSLNEEVEIVIKFIDRVGQFTKAEFNKHYRVIRD